jgi:hypothetical protein
MARSITRPASRLLSSSQRVHKIESAAETLGPAHGNDR